MKQLWRENGLFLILSLILIIVLGLALVYIPKGELHLYLCDRHTYARDIFYKYYTKVAEWFPYLLCLTILLLGRIGDGLFATSAMALSALTTQLIKRLVNAPRPLNWFTEHMPQVNLPEVEGVRMHLWHSFPSGHTTSFFALALVASILAANSLATTSKEHRTITSNKRLRSIILQMLIFILAATGAYSRIYLNQHFASDILAGIVVGLLITILCYLFWRHFKTKKWYNYRIFAKK